MNEIKPPNQIIGNIAEYIPFSNFNILWKPSWMWSLAHVVVESFQGCVWVLVGDVDEPGAGAACYVCYGGVLGDGDGGVDVEF